MAAPLLPILLGAAALLFLATKGKGKPTGGGQTPPPGQPGQPGQPPPPGPPLPPIIPGGGNPQTLPGPDPQCVGLDAGLLPYQCAEIKAALNPAYPLTVQMMQVLQDRYPPAKYPITAQLLWLRKQTLQATGH